MTTSRNITDRKILVTGGTGSFGKMFIKRILEFAPQEVIVFSRDEDKQGFMRKEFSEPKLRFVLGDIRDSRSVREALRGVDVVIHAAALKWIDEVEYNVWQGILTNVYGAQNIIEAARDMGVEKVLALSTDKAVEPVNAYGMAKALQERLMTTANIYDNGTKTVFVSTRYGNVIGSRGSVVPLFKSLVDIGKPLTITDPNMTRFMMTLEESVDLVLTALEEGVGGEVFSKKMPGHTVRDLAEVILEEAGRSKDDIKIIGTRPGEKIHESLISPLEGLRTVTIGEYYVILPQIHIGVIEEKYKDMPRLGEVRYSSDTTERMSKEDIRRVLKTTNWL